jgi:defect-in-organelle-trafficking protein DotC
MRLSPVVKSGMTGLLGPQSFKAGFLVLASVIAMTFSATPCFAQAGAPPGTVTPTSTSQQPSYTQPYPTVYAPPAYQAPYQSSQALMQQLAAMQAGQPNGNSPTDSFGNPNPNYKAPEVQIDRGSVDDPNSLAYKANKLADQAQNQRSDSATLGKGLADQKGVQELTPPPDMQMLQQINKYQAGTANSISDDAINADIALDMRKQAQKEAALSYGARGGLAKRNYQIMERMQGFDRALDQVFNFRSLLIKAPSGLLIEPPIVKESDKALLITDNGDEAAEADKVYDINKKAKIVSAPRDWRQYLLQSWSAVPPPPRVLWPRTAKEQADWSTWVAQGWDAGVEQADQIFESNVNQLTADYNGMVRYRMLLAQDMISAPYAMHEDRGVTGSQNQMRIGDRAVRITGPSQFLTKAELWKPADQQ